MGYRSWIVRREQINGADVSGGVQKRFPGTTELAVVDGRFTSYLHFIIYSCRINCFRNGVAVRMDIDEMSRTWRGSGTSQPSNLSASQPIACSIINFYRTRLTSPLN
jgi:hypothetical protein